MARLYALPREPRRSTRTAAGGGSGLEEERDEPVLPVVAVVLARPPLGEHDAQQAAEALDRGVEAPAPAPPAAGLLGLRPARGEPAGLATGQPRGADVARAAAGRDEIAAAAVGLRRRDGLPVRRLVAPLVVGQPAQVQPPQDARTLAVRAHFSQCER
jgi:hypothetical protein